MSNNTGGWVTVNLITWSDEFENGRQEVLEDLKNTIERRFRFIQSLPESVVYSHRNGIADTYKELLNDIERLKTKRRDINLIG